MGKITYSYNSYPNCPEATEYSKSRASTAAQLGGIVGFASLGAVFGLVYTASEFFSKNNWSDFIGGIVFAVWYYLLNNLEFDVNVARGYIMALMVFIQNIHVFNCRSENRSAFSVSLKSNYFIVLGVIGSVLLQVIVMESSILSEFLQTTSVPIIDLIRLIGVSIVILIIMEIYKYINNKFIRKS